MAKKELFISFLQDGIRAGEKIATDRKNYVLPDLALRKTSGPPKKSDWFLKPCPICKDYFRENDLVRLCPKCKQPYHDFVGHKLHCWSQHFSPNTKCISCQEYEWNGQLPIKDPRLQTEVLFPAIIQQFYDGLGTTWKVFGNPKIRLVQTTDDMVGLNCMGCKYKIRVGDLIVKCPCSPGCHAYFHCDVPGNWNCWNEWHGEVGKYYCPISSKVYTQIPAKLQFNRVTDEKHVRS